MPTIRIDDLRIDLPDRYQPGHQLTEGEARALNGLRAENVRNNLSAEIRRSLGQGQSPEELRLRVLSYEATYQFGTRTAAGAKPSPLEAQIERIAQREAFVQLGQHASSEELASLAVRLSADPAVVEEARKALEEARKISAKALEDLL